ncbi:MAG: FKBP-type peptidyl-prolyl cis-trans isomerase [Bacteroidota bacterium]
MTRFITILGIIIGICSCGKDDVVITEVDDEISAWLDTMNISASRDNGTGIYFYPEVTNSAGTQATNGSVVAIYYTLSDLNGNLIASHRRGNGDSLVFKLGASAVYPVGLDFCVGLMNVGETYNFILPPAQAYRELTSRAINPSVIALLQIELAAVQSEADLFQQDNEDIQAYIDDNFLDSLQINPLDSTVLFDASGIVYKRLRAGNGALPLNGDTIVVDFTGRFLNDASFTSGSGFEWIFGANQPRELLPSFEFGASLMQAGERALIIVPSSQGYRESALIIPDFITNDLINDAIIPDYVSSVPPYRTLLFEITRVD